MIKDKIEFFINQVKDIYKDIYIDYFYNSDTDVYEIWHNKKELEYKNHEFRKFTGKLLTELFIADGIYNIYMTYNYEKSQELFSGEFITSFKKVDFFNNQDIKKLVDFVIEDQSFSRSYQENDNKTIIKRNNLAKLYNKMNTVTQTDFSLEAA